MILHFTCKHCARKLFAHASYEGCRAACPACQALIEVPIPLHPVQFSTDSHDPYLLDMEIGPEGAQAAEVRPLEPASGPFLQPVADSDSHSIPPERLARAEGAVLTCRAVAVLATLCSVGWVSYLALSALFLPAPPYPAIVFSGFLVYGLLWSTRQMLAGPANVHVAAALAILLCMPLTIQMGLPVVDDEVLKAVVKESETKGQPMTLATARALIFLLFSGMGVLFSLPVWFAAARITLLRRLKGKSGGQTR
jgi:hypothetical protein